MSRRRRKPQRQQPQQPQQRQPAERKGGAAVRLLLALDGSEAMLRLVLSCRIPARPARSLTNPTHLLTGGGPTGMDMDVDSPQHHDNNDDDPRLHLLPLALRQPPPPFPLPPAKRPVPATAWEPGHHTHLIHSRSFSHHEAQHQHHDRHTHTGEKRMRGECLDASIGRSIDRSIES